MPKSLVLTALACAVGALVSGAPAAARDLVSFDSGKLILTNGVTTIEGSGGGGLATWATISGMGTDRAVGVSAHATIVELPDFRLDTHGIAVGIRDRVELAYARQNFNTRAVGAALGLGRGFQFNQDIFSAKVRLAGDLVYGPGWLPQVSVGVEHKRNLDGAIVRAVGAKASAGTDFTVSATKLFLGASVLANATLRVTKANQFGLLGFGGDKHAGRSVQFEGSLAYMITRRLVVGGEWRTRPDNLGIAREDDAKDLFAAWAVTRHVTLTAAYVDVGSVATFAGQRGGLLSLQLAY
ncbi:DUF3034 family protein [Novosphingobium sp.]|uniref:DUF3034 family protein n=1 Tax=Novosphingobium sp. TaxID=1874826 RepID=UPI001D2C1AA2|nr:DUF3034 family protein [Novosphingobium sp.]MBX9664397.1 DUF3034 family protein [Novosphingobium sp.]